jgi:hypothetical protein
MTTHAGTRPGTSNAFARQRDALILWLLLRHPATAGMLAGIRLFPTRKKASTRLRRLVERGLIRCLGTVSLKDGRPEQVYARGRWKGDNLLHEVQLTRVCLRIDADSVRRGTGEVDAELRPDAELLIAGERYYLEMDCGTIGYADIVQTRFAKYRSRTDLVLWVCPTASRMEGLRRHAAVIRETALFTTLEQALADPHASVWVDFEGERAALPRSQGRGTKAGAKPGDKGGANPGTLAPPGCGEMTDTRFPGARAVPLQRSTY